MSVRTPELETRRQSPHVVRAALGYEIFVLQGGDTSVRLRLESEGSKIVIGTAPSCELRLQDPSVSRRHAALEVTERGLLLTDLDSTNGTCLNEARVVAGYVGARDRLRLGTTVLSASAFESDPQKMRAASSFGRMASASPRMLNVFGLCEQLAPTDIPVVLEGGTGTGKELLAECIHEASPRSQRPFVVLDCRAIPRDLFEAHVFGSVDGSRGTTQPGVFETADGGTLFIDEPGDLDLDSQTKLLRMLDKGVALPLGAAKPVRVNARILVATTRNLDKLIEEGKFREDLYYRLAGARIELPPLRRRREDVPLLASELWTELGGKGLLPDEFVERFEAYDWPGNVRELRRAVERFLALGDDVSLLVMRSHRYAGRSEQLSIDPERDDVLRRIVNANLGFSEARQCVLDEFERAYLEKALADSGGNVAAAAAKSGIARRHFQRIRARQR